MLRRARVNHSWSSHHENLALLLAGPLKLSSNFANHHARRLFDRDIAGHELESIFARDRSLLRNNANSLVAHDDFHALFDAAKLGGGCLASGAVNHDGAIHQRRLNFNFAVVKSHERLLIGRGIKLLRKDAVRGRSRQLNALFFDHFGAMLPQAQNQIVKCGRRGPSYFDPRKALVGPVFADLDLGDFETAAVGDDFIEHLGQNERIDDVAAQLDRLGKHRANLAGERVRASRAAANYPRWNSTCPLAPVSY